jgi:pimeloyl-ACP methyl ester carboxylesterase
MVKSDPIVGKYIYLTVQGIEYRVYYEEAGKGIPIICQHAGGSQTLEWRFMLNDPEIISKYHVVSADLPYHGKSLPPDSVEWWKEDYKLTKGFFEDFQIELSRALGLEKPIYLGQNSAGFLALDLALDHPDDFRAVIGVNTAIKGGPSTMERYYHPAIGNNYKRACGLGFCAPMSPEKLRRADSWCGMLSAPPVTGGDLYFYFYEHNLIGKTHLIDTSRCAVYLLTGEYDSTSSIEDTIELAKQIKGAKFQEMKNMSHSGMPENPPLFKTYLMPILEEISKKPLQK